MHVDDKPGDRAAICRGLMAPITVEYHPAKGFMIVHKCLRCGKTGRNQIAYGSDNFDLVCLLSAR
jgi:RNHCP domain